jgi:hypothetical protein
MSLTGILLGLINIAIVVAILLLVGAVIVMFAKWMSFTIDWNVQRLYMLVVLLVALYMLVALLLGLPSIRVIGFQGVAGSTLAAYPAGSATHL